VAFTAVSVALSLLGDDGDFARHVEAGADIGDRAVGRGGEGAAAAVGHFDPAEPASAARSRSVPSRATRAIWVRPAST
jgi:hypothetical protein